MIRAAVFSDSHGEDVNLRWLMEQCWKFYGRMDVYVHCGDGNADFQRAENFIRARDPHALLIGVKGNCDFGADLPDTEEITLEGAKLLITHGHRFQVKSTYAALDLEARRRGCAAALFGHTHVACVEQRGVLLVNPGSAANDSMAVLTIRDGKVSAEIMDF
ncbi:MAG: YfcE family phosphodiesterase [Clostridia bacterium]|nr:YfcE family phosphodiesterase [Clostridia bacterium]